ncbi:MAG TPA: hypothetical protein VF107_05315, partial [Burkholderiaceae bacterium]
MAQQRVRPERQRDPVVGAREAVAHQRDAEERQRHAGEIEWQHGVRIEPRRQREDRGRAEERERGRKPEGDPAAVDQEAAQRVDLVVVGVFGNESLRDQRQAEMHGVAGEHEPGPHRDIDAEVEAAHPARERDLRKEGDAGAGDPDGEGHSRHALRRAMLAVEPGMKADAQARDASRLRGRRGQVFRFGQGH